VEARTNDTTRRDKALSSGAQYVSTDYMQPTPALGLIRPACPRIHRRLQSATPSGTLCGLPVEAAR